MKQGRRMMRRYLQKGGVAFGIFAVCAGLLLSSPLLFPTWNREECRTKILDEENQFSPQVPEEESSAAEWEALLTLPAPSSDPVLPERHEILDFPVVYQLPQLPTGCEITALTMVLQYYGLPADKVEMATRYLPTLPARFVYGEDGRRYGGDLVHYFVGDPTTENGYICGAPALVQAANHFLSDEGSALQAMDGTGTSLEQLYQWVSQDRPVVVLVTIGMNDRNPTRGWYTQEGTYVEWSTNDHGAVLIGYTPDRVILADPLAGRVEYSRAQFEEVFLSRGSQCVALE